MMVLAMLILIYAAREALQFVQHTHTIIEVHVH